MARASWFAGKTWRATKRKRGFNAGIGGPDPEIERDPPPEPTPVSFPAYHSNEGVAWSTSSSAPDFRSLFAKILRPGDISDDHAQALNIEMASPCTMDAMLRSMADGTSYLWEPPIQEPPSELQTDMKMRQGFDDRITELQVDNDMAFRVLTRRVAEGVKPPRLAHMRKFWEGLEVMSQYWDNSIDRYWEAAQPTEEEGRSAKRPRPASDFFSHEQHDDELTTEDRAWPLSPNDNSASADGDETRAFERDTESESSDRLEDLDRDDGVRLVSNGPSSSMRYKGRRTSTGRNMPELFRTATVKAFVEGTIWPFRTSLVPPRVMPIVQFDGLNLPVRQTAAVYRMPNDRTKARQGWLAGPILGVQARPEVEFAVESAEETLERARLDFMREVGGLLQLAQERRRQHQIEVKPGEGKWWTTKPRWGGGPGGEVENDVGNSDVVALAGEALEAASEKNGRKESSGKNRGKKSPGILWKELRCGKGVWDPKIEYEAIGKDSQSEYDEIFLVSSINHHISILKLTIHDKYTDCLTSGTLPNPLPTDAEWSRPKLQRTQWFDLFDKEQRVEAFRGLWSVMTYMTRQEPR